MDLDPVVVHIVAAFLEAQLVQDAFLPHRPLVATEVNVDLSATHGGLGRSVCVQDVGWWLETLRERYAEEEKI